MKRRRPHQLRFLSPLRWAALALAFAWILSGIQSVICGMLPRGAQCLAVVPGWFGIAVFATVLLAIAACAYRFWLDFYQGEYYLDLEDPHRRDR